MALIADRQSPVSAGDVAFYRVDTRRPPHELETGVAADAVNLRFDDGRPRPRFGVNRQAWGALGINLVAGAVWPITGIGGYYSKGVTLTPGAWYYYIPGNELTLATGTHTQNPIPNLVAHAGWFQAVQADYILESRSSNVPITTQIIEPRGNACAFSRFNDPQGYDCQVVLTDDWRDQSGEDGGRGRAWKIQPANAPVLVSLNGHDVWGTTRLVPCYNGLVALRQDNERHYFSAETTLSITNTTAAADTLAVATDTLFTGRPVTVTAITGASGTYYVRLVSGGVIALYDTAAHATAGGATGLFDVTVDGESGTLTKLAVDPATSRIQLNAAPNWVNSDKVIFYTDTNSYFSGTKPPQNATAYFVKNITGNLIELYSDQSLSTQVTFTSALGRFWIERAADFPGFYGNAAPPLLAQPNGSGNTIWETGFAAVPENVVVTAIDTSTNVATAPNHRLLPGDHVTVSGVNTTGPTPITDAYVYPVSEHAVRLYTTQAAALAQSSPIALVSTSNGTLTKAGASGLPTPGGREGAYYQNRVIVVNGRDTLLISDALDPLHFTPFQAAVTANLGESDAITAVWPMGTNDAVLILKENSLELLNNFSGGPTAWTLTSLTREYGCLAPLSVAQVGNDVWFLSRKGVASVTQTQNGVLQGVADPVSKAMKKYIDLIDWRAAANATGHYWNNRYVVAVPLKGQTGTLRNNGILSHNFLNTGMIRGAQDGVYHFETMFGWEGVWQGDQLQPYAWARVKVYGEERLCLVDTTGQVSWLGDGFMDGTTPVATQLITRRYTGDDNNRKLWLAATLVFDAQAPSLTVQALFPGANASVSLVAGKTFDKTKYLIYGQADYNPATATPATFTAPGRADYAPSAGEILAGPPDQHQNHLLPLRLRRQAWGVQLQISNAAGSVRLQSVQVEGWQRDITSAETV